MGNSPVVLQPLNTGGWALLSSVLYLSVLSHHSAAHPPVTAALLLMSYKESVVMVKKISVKGKSTADLSHSFLH